ncbi:MAG: hypothetical protein IMF11_08960 [Proteobacteria bacterium]|nr:hypothetical protein [Pseudomonadota bacterium]
MSGIKTKVEWLGIDIQVGERKFHFIFQEAKAMYEALSEAMLRLGVKKKEDIKVGQIHKDEVISIIIGILAGLTELGCIEKKHSEKILKDVEGYMEVRSNGRI